MRLTQELKAKELTALTNIDVVGLMGMATFTDDTQQIKNEFDSLNKFFNQLQNNHINIKTLSIGMSGDYQIAIASGSTMVRIGSAIFGER